MKNRVAWIDLIKLIACCMVVLLHSITNGLNSNSYEIGLFIYYIGVFAIPLFFMVNGYLQLHKKKEIKYLLVKIFNILKLVIFWTTGLYALKRIIGIETKNYIIETLGSLLQKGQIPVFWFLGSLIIIYILLPLLQKIYKRKDYNLFVYISIGVCIFLDIIYIVLYKRNNFILKNNIIQTFRLYTWINYYLIGGFIRKNSEIIKKISNKKIYIFTVLLFVLSIIYQSIFAYKFYGNLYAESFYDSPMIIISSILLFTSISRIRLDKYNNLIIKLSSLTMGVYILHYTVMGVITKIFAFNNNYLSIIIFLLTIVISFFISYILNKISILKKMLTI